MEIRNVIRAGFSRQKAYIVAACLMAAVIVITLMTSPFKVTELSNDSRSHFVSSFPQAARTSFSQPTATHQLPLHAMENPTRHGGTVEMRVFDGKQNVTFDVLTNVPPDPPTGKARRLPQCIVVGSPKTGTFTFKTFLGLHPDVVIPAEHEIHFFDDEENYSKGYSWYRHQMSPSLPGQVTMEKTPRYLYYPAAPDRIYAMNKNVKLILVVRHPFERTVSCYVHKNEKLAKAGVTRRKKFENTVVNKRSGLVNASDHCVGPSLYGKHLTRWLKRFPSSQFHFVDGDNLIANPAKELQLVEKYLDVKPFFKPAFFHYNKQKGFYCLRTKPGQDVCMPSSKGRPHPEVSDLVKKKLLDFFVPYNDVFYEMAGRNFNWTNDINLLGS